MRSGDPDHFSDNPWPHDMRISVDEPYALIYLLFVREGWGIQVDDIPPASPSPVTGTSRRPSAVDEVDAATRWRREWLRAWTQFEPLDRMVREPDGEITQLLRDTSDELLADAVSTMPSTFWADGTDREAFDAWLMSLRDDHSRPLEEHPERVCLDALVPAWRTGLTTIVQLPYAGYFAERINQTTLVVSSTTRHGRGLYRRALRTPPRR